MDNTFNYQLTIQKLEEELSLYRNGTTGQELLDLIHEKDAEILSLKAINESNDEKLRKLAKSSSEVLSRYTVLQDETASVMNEQKLTQNLMNQCEVDLRTQKELVDAMKVTKKKDEAELSRLFEELSNRCADIDKLQTRCGTLVSEKMEKTRALEDDIFAKDAQLKLLTDANAKQNEKLLAQSVQISNHQKEHLEWENKTINLGSSLMTQTQSNIEEVNKHKAQLEEAKAVGAELKGQLEVIMLERDSSQKEVATLTQQVAQAHQTFVTQQEHLNGVIEAKDSQINEMLQRMRSLEDQQQLQALKATTAASSMNLVQPKSKSPLPEKATNRQGGTIPKTRNSVEKTQPSSATRCTSGPTLFRCADRQLRDSTNTYRSSVGAAGASTAIVKDGAAHASVTSRGSDSRLSAAVKVSQKVKSPLPTRTSTGTSSSLSPKRIDAIAPPGMLSSASVKPSRPLSRF